MVTGFILNFFIGILAYLALHAFTRLRRVDKATVAGYYGSDSAGTFVTCLGVLATAKIAYDAYMPVMLAIMEIPGCLVALYLVSRLRHKGMDPSATCPTSPATTPTRPAARRPRRPRRHHGHTAAEDVDKLAMEDEFHAKEGEDHGRRSRPAS